MSTSSVTVEPGLIVVRLSGPPSEANARVMLASLKAQSSENKIDCALFEVDVSGGLDPTRIMGIVKDLPALGFPPTFKFGIVLLGEGGRGAVEFAETAAVNRGWQVKIFPDSAGARHWLSAR